MQSDISVARLRRDALVNFTESLYAGTATGEVMAVPATVRSVCGDRVATQGYRNLTRKSKRKQKAIINRVTDSFGTVLVEDIRHALTTDNVEELVAAQLRTTFAGSWFLMWLGKAILPLLVQWLLARWQTLSAEDASTDTTS